MFFNKIILLSVALLLACFFSYFSLAIFAIFTLIISHSLRPYIITIIIYIILKKFENDFTPDVKLLIFADDLLIYTSSHCIDINNNRLSSTLKNITHSLQNKGLEIAYDKTHAMILTKKYKLEIPSIITLNNSSFEKKPCLKFLGLYLDSKLTWKPHMNYIIEKCEKKLNILKAISTTSWGSDPSTCLLLYRSLIRPHIDYGCLFHNARSKIDNN